MLNHKIRGEIDLSGYTLQWNGLKIYGNLLQRLKHKGIRFFYSGNTCMIRTV